MPPLHNISDGFCFQCSTVYFRCALMTINLNMNCVETVCVGVYDTLRTWFSVRTFQESSSIFDFLKSVSLLQENVP